MNARARARERPSVMDAGRRVDGKVRCFGARG